jgi:hypothetical protein
LLGLALKNVPTIDRISVLCSKISWVHYQTIKKPMIDVGFFARRVLETLVENPNVFGYLIGEWPFLGTMRR